MYCICPM